MLTMSGLPQEDAGLLPWLYSGEGGRQGVEYAVTFHHLLARGREAGRPPQLGRQLSEERVLPGRGCLEGGGHLQPTTGLGGPQPVLLVGGEVERRGGGQIWWGETGVGLGNVQHHH